MSKYNRYIVLDSLDRYNEKNEPEKLVINLDRIKCIKLNRKLFDKPVDCVILDDVTHYDNYIYVAKEFNLVEKLEMLGERIYDF